MNAMDYIQSFKQMLTNALAEKSVMNAKPMSDIEIEYLAATLRKQAKVDEPKEIEEINNDLKKTLFDMILLIKSESENDEKLHARKLLRRISEVSINMETTTTGLIH